MPELSGAQPIDRATFTRAAALALVPGAMSLMKPTASEAADSYEISSPMNQSKVKQAIKTIQKCIAELEKIRQVVDQKDRCPPYPYKPNCPIFDDALDNLEKVVHALSR